jgi:[ribosomal protein S18]-alanine N-acetyltransferase
VTIRAATTHDGQALAAIHAACFDIAWSRQTLEDFIDAGTVSIFGNPPTAFLIMRRVLDEAEIITLAVHPASRQKGQARALLVRALADMAATGVARIFLEVAIDNEAACYLYRALGFVQIGARKGYYRRSDGQLVDALILSRALTADTILPNT